MPNLSVVAEDDATDWERIMVANWYGGGHWSELAVRRTAPVLLGLFSLVTLFAHQRMSEGADAVQRTAWYDRPHPTFSDALALGRKGLWTREQATFCGSSGETDAVKVPRRSWSG